MNLKQSLAYARKILTSNSVEDASLESELLLRHILGISRAQLYTDLDLQLKPAQEEAFLQLINRRSQGEPSAYIIGHREFFGLDFYVDYRVLIPRPESEILVEKAINLFQNKPVSTIAEIGTGSGAIAISLAKNIPSARIFATDISEKALEVARSNCEKHGVVENIILLHGDMLEPITESVDLIIANLPYVREAELTHTGPLSYEPELALNGGIDGVVGIKRLCHQIGSKLQPEGYLLLEIGYGQVKTVSALLKKTFPIAQIQITPDYAGIERVVSMCLTQD